MGFWEEWSKQSADKLIPMDVLPKTWRSRTWDGIVKSLDGIVNLSMVGLIGAGIVATLNGNFKKTYNPSSLYSKSWNSLFDHVVAITFWGSTACLFLCFFLHDLAKKKAAQVVEDEREERSVDARIKRATSSLRLAGKLMAELQAEMQARTAALERLKAERDGYEALASMHKEEAKAVSELIEAVIGDAHSRLGRSNRRDQIVFFVLGLTATIPIQIVANWLT